MNFCLLIKASYVIGSAGFEKLRLLVIVSGYYDTDKKFKVGVFSDIFALLFLKESILIIMVIMQPFNVLNLL